MPVPVIERAVPSDVEGLAQLLVDCVLDGASVGYLDDVGPSDATLFWQRRLADPDALVLVAREGSVGEGAGDRVVGTVTLLAATPPNGRHRAEVAKLLVSPQARGRGLGRLLLRAVEREALARGRWLLLLDTQTGSAAQGLYADDGWVVVGVVDDHAATPDGRLAPTTFMTKRLPVPEA